jgi:hypothetical protein
MQPSNNTTSILMMSMIGNLGLALALDGTDDRAGSRRQSSDHGGHENDEPAREPIGLEQTPSDTDGC